MHVTALDPLLALKLDLYLAWSQQAITLPSHHPALLQHLDLHCLVVLLLLHIVQEVIPHPHCRTPVVVLLISRHQKQSQLLEWRQLVTLLLTGHLFLLAKHLNLTLVVNHVLAPGQTLLPLSPAPTHHLPNWAVSPDHWLQLTVIPDWLVAATAATTRHSP